MPRTRKESSIWQQCGEGHNHKSGNEADHKWGNEKMEITLDKIRRLLHASLGPQGKGFCATPRSTAPRFKVNFERCRSVVGSLPELFEMGMPKDFKEGGLVIGYPLHRRETPSGGIGALR